MSPHFCTGCGAALADDATFCTSCGSAVAAPAAPPGPPGTSGRPFGAMAPPEGDAPRSSSRPVGLIVAVAVLASLLLVALGGVAVWQVANWVGADDETDEVALEPINASVPDPFTNSVSTGVERTPGSAPGTSGPTATTQAPAAGPGGVRLAGASPGLYGGTRNNGTCDAGQLVRFLEANPDLAGAWAGVQGIERAGIRSYVATLTPVVLTRDTSVINHGYARGRPTARPAVLQAGTAVLVDRYGVPRVKCGCGNPLLAPRPPTTRTTYRGQRWPAFRPETVVTVEVTVQVQTFVLIDLDGGAPFSRPPGSDGGSDRPVDQAEYCRQYPDAPVCRGASDTTTTTTTPPTTQPPTTLPPLTSPPATAPDGRPLGGGDVQVTLTWATDADLDLHVVDPSGAEISFASPASASGGQLDVDDRAGTGTTSTHVENVYWPSGGAPSGSYTAFVRYFRGSGDPSPFTLDVLVNGQRVAGTSGSLSGGDSETVTFQF